MILPRILQRILRRLGIRPTVTLVSKRYPQFEIGRGSYGAVEVIDFGEGSKLFMGSWCSIATGTSILLGGGHRTEWATTYPFTVTDPTLAHIKGHPVSRGDVTIGNDVWIGTEAMILSGVTIGNGAVIAARSVVSRDVPPYAIVAGSPAKIVRYRFDEETIARFQALKWWDWTEERIRNAAPHMLNADVGGFLDLAEQEKL